MNNTQSPPKLVHLPSVGFNIRIYFSYWLSLAFAVLFGFLLQFIFVPNRSYKYSIVSGCKSIQKNLFKISLSLHLLFFIWILYVFSKNSILQNTFNKSLVKYLKKLRSGFSCSNVMLLLCYFLLKNKLFLPLSQSFDTSLSKEALEIILSGAVLNHLYYLCQTFLENRINTQLMTYICLIVKSLLFHNAYCLLWISWIDASLSELVFSFVISCAYAALVQLSSIDYIILLFFQRKKSNRKAKDIIYMRKH